MFSKALLQPEKRKISAVEDLVEQNEKAKDKKCRIRYWVRELLHFGLIQDFAVDRGHCSQSG